MQTLDRRPKASMASTSGLFVFANGVEGHSKLLSLGSGTVEIQCISHSLDYPLARYAKKVGPQFADSALQEKYRRLRRILSEFRSHKKGGLAKYRDKIEHQRVLQNEMGRKVLAALLEARILVRDEKLYHVDPEVCDQRLGISWLQLRQYQSSSSLESFLREINGTAEVVA